MKLQNTHSYYTLCERKGPKQYDDDTVEEGTGILQQNINNTATATHS
jgi:hypothetical protein